MKKNVLFAVVFTTAVLVLPSCKKPSHPPDTPAVPSGPASGAVDDALVFSSSAIDPDDDSVSIRFGWGDGDTSDWSSPAASGNTITAAHVWNAVGEYDITSQARDTRDSVSGWSLPHILRILAANHAPGQPSTPSGPQEVRTSSEYEFASCADDSDGDSVSLRFAWSEGDTSDWQAYVRSGETVSVVHAWAATGAYSVRAQARDVRESVSEWSPALPVAVSVYFNTAPLAPRPVGPDSGYVGISYAYSTLASDPEGDNVSVRFLWGADTGLWSNWVASGEAVSDSYEWQVSGPIPVRAQARDNIGARSDWSPACTLVISSEGTIRWVQGDVIPWSSACPAIGADGTVYATGMHGLFALDTGGGVRWSYAAEIYTGPAVAPDGTMYFLQGRNLPDTLVALNPSGVVRWRLRVGECYSSPALAADGTIYVGTFDGDLWAVSPEGTERWRLDLGDEIWSSAAIGTDGVVYVASTDSLFAVNPDGTRRWTRGGGGLEYFGIAIAHDGTIYYHTRPDSVWCLLAVNPDGSEKWRYGLSGVSSTPVVGPDGTVYLGSYHDDCVYAFSSSGMLKWRRQLGDLLNVALAVAADGTVYVASGRVVALNPDGIPIWRSDAYCRWAGMTVGPDGTIYLTSSGEGLSAIHGGPPLATGEWPKFQRDLRNTGRVGGR